MTLTIGGTRLKVHPLMLMFPVAGAMLGARDDFAALMIALTAHEAAHLLMAKALGVGISQISLMPFGGAIRLDNPYALPPGKLLAVAAAGPAGSLLALLTAAALAHWRVLSPYFALALMQVNWVLMLFNLLPALPLDGGRMLYALLAGRAGRARAAEIGIWSGRAVAALLVGMAVYPALTWGRFNLSPAFAAIFILASAADERRALGSAHIKTLLSEL
ncbi:MAG: site-2 protease family protein, partial [Clostridia bacterium]|nr:site-2 protease family protein [Clostridia bacterium]